jgi:DNA-binding transcriptional ArsR family regulator
MGWCRKQAARHSISPTASSTYPPGRTREPSVAGAQADDAARADFAGYPAHLCCSSGAERTIGGHVHQYNRNAPVSQTLVQVCDVRDGRGRARKEPPCPPPVPVDAAIYTRPLEETARMFGLLSATVRRHIVWLLAAGDCDVGTLADETGQTIATVSHHLRKLKLGGIVGARRQGRRQSYIPSNVRVFYSIQLQARPPNSSGGSASGSGRPSRAMIRPRQAASCRAICTFEMLPTRYPASWRFRWDTLEFCSVRSRRGVLATRIWTPRSASPQLNHVLPAAPVLALVSAGLEPVVAAEGAVEERADKQHQAQDRRVACGSGMWSKFIP